MKENKFIILRRSQKKVRAPLNSKAIYKPPINHVKSLKKPSNNKNMLITIFFICLVVVAADMTGWTRSQNSAARHRAISLNRIRFGEDTFAGYKLRTIPDKRKAAQDNSKAARDNIKAERNALRNHMRNSYRKRMI